MRSTSNADAEYWKKQCLNLKRELMQERRQRILVERERDHLKDLMDSSDINELNRSMNDEFSVQRRLPLNNEDSFNSINGSTSTIYSNSNYTANPMLYNTPNRNVLNMDTI